MAQHAALQAIAEDRKCRKAGAPSVTAGRTRVGGNGFEVASTATVDMEGEIRVEGQQELLRKPEPKEIRRIMLSRQKR